MLAGWTLNSPDRKYALGWDGMSLVLFYSFYCISPRNSIQFDASILAAEKRKEKTKLPGAQTLLGLPFVWSGVIPTISLP
jgi:hypothetical protein